MLTHRITRNLGSRSVCFLASSFRNFGGLAEEEAQQHRLRTAEEFDQQSAAFLKAQTTEQRINKIVIPYVGYMNIVPNNDSILEIACGPGIVARHCVQKNPLSYIGIDISDKMLEIAENEVKNEIDSTHGAITTDYSFVNCKAESLPFDDNSFDIIVSRLAFHHFYDIYPILSEIKRVMKPISENGRLLLCDLVAPTDDPTDIANQLRESIEILRDNSHVRMFGRNEMVSILNDKCGFINGKVMDVIKDERDFTGFLEQTSNQAVNKRLVGNKSDYPLQVLANQLCESGYDCGMNLRKDDSGELIFTHEYGIWQANKA